MNMKINTICFIFLLFLLIGVVSASDDNNETLQTIEQPDVVKINVNSSDAVLEKSLKSDLPLQASSKSTPTVSASSSKSKVSLKASDMKMYYGDGSKFKITLKDNKKKAIKNAKIKFTINSKTYTKETNSNGEASIKLGFASGKYKVTATYDGSSKYAKKSISNTVTIKTTINANDASKYYKNKDSYTATFYNTNGKVLKKVKVDYFINGKSAVLKTNSKGKISFKVNLKPGSYQLALHNSVSGELIYKTITIKSTLEEIPSDLTNPDLNYQVKIYDSNGKGANNKKVTFIMDSKKFTIKSNSKGIATFSQHCDYGYHTIKVQYDGLEINKLFFTTLQLTEFDPSIIPTQVKKTNFTHSISIPDYVNVSGGYVFQNAEYALKTGYDGIIKMPKDDVFDVKIDNSEYFFSKNVIDGKNSYVLDGSCYLIPFDGSPVLHKYNKNSLGGEGILIYNENDSNIIEYRGLSESNADMFAVFLSHYLFGETITYVQNNKTKATVTFFTNSYDEKGVMYNINKLNLIYAYNSETRTYLIANAYTGDYIKYANTNVPVQFSSYGSVIPEQISSEKIITKLSVGGVEEFEKPEIITYGQSPNYGSSVGFEVLQSFAIINDKVTQDMVEDWVLKNTSYVPKFCIQNVYEMFMIGLETAWISDLFADIYAQNLSVTWQRDRPAVILGGVNLEDIYLHILNADMGMTVNGDNDQNKVLFRLYNSINLPNLEEFAISQISNSNSSNTTNSLDILLKSVSNNNFSMVQMGDMFYILSEDGGNSTVIINSTSGVAEVLMYGENFAYKGAKVDSDCDWCSIQQSVHWVLSGISHLIYNKIKADISIYNYVKSKINPLCVIGYGIFSTSVGLAAGVAEGATLLGVASFASVVGPMVGIQSIGVQVRERLLDKKDNYAAYDMFTFTRNGPFQYKKCFNIPQSDGTVHYVEVGILSDNKLDRNNAVYISPSGTKKLTKEETYKYFDEDTWVIWAVPKKYQKYPAPF